MSRQILVTDFDGTVCQNEFYQLVRERLLPKDAPNYWEQFTSGSVSHLQVLQAYFSGIRASEADVIAMLADMQIEPRFAELVRQLEEAGWEVIVASAGCGWYIERLLTPLDLSLKVHTNPGRWVGGDAGLAMEPPYDSPFYCAEHGINKAAIIQDALSQADTVAFAGDGLTDVNGMLLLPPENRFARRDCAAVLDQKGEPYQPFDRWAEVAENLLQRSRAS